MQDSEQPWLSAGLGLQQFGVEGHEDDGQPWELGVCSPSPSDAIAMQEMDIPHKMPGDMAGRIFSLVIQSLTSSAHLSSPIHLLSPPIQPYIDTVANPQRSSTHGCPIPCCSLHTAPSTFLMQWPVPWAGCGLCRCKQASHFPFQGHNEGTHSGNPTAR